MTRLLVVDDHPIVTAGIKEFLFDYEEFTVAGEAGSGMEAVRMVREADWDVVLLDISLPDMNAIEALSQIRHIKPALPVLVLTMQPEDQYAFKALRARVSGYLSKDCTPEGLISAIRTAVSGHRYASPVFGDQPAGELVGEGHKPPHTELSDRELQVFCKLAAGLAVFEIADELLLSRKTVSTYRLRIVEKMRIKSNADIIYYGIKHGLVV